MGSTKHACTAGRGSLPRPAEPLVQIWVALALIVSGVDRGERRGLESRIASINQHPIGIQSGSNRDPIGIQSAWALHCCHQPAPKNRVKMVHII